ncbi:hypothetical protein F5887DRAFT_916102 [Amanita rubescens]|nr:hypothetical protein F5887DRAFT_916102 [Amanita rubescens]
MSNAFETSRTSLSRMGSTRCSAEKSASSPAQCRQMDPYLFVRAGAKRILKRGGNRGKEELEKKAKQEKRAKEEKKSRNPPHLKLPHKGCSPYPATQYKGPRVQLEAQLHSKPSPDPRTAPTPATQTAVQGLPLLAPHGQLARRMGWGTSNSLMTRGSPPPDCKILIIGGDKSASSGSDYPRVSRRRRSEEGQPLLLKRRRSRGGMGLERRRRKGRRHRRATNGARDGASAATAPVHNFGFSPPKSGRVVALVLAEFCIPESKQDSAPVDHNMGNGSFSSRRQAQCQIVKWHPHVQELRFLSEYEGATKIEHTQTELSVQVFEGSLHLCFLSLASTATVWKLLWEGSTHLGCLSASGGAGPGVDLNSSGPALLVSMYERRPARLFTKQGLLNMLEKRLVFLNKLPRVSRPPELPPNEAPPTSTGAARVTDLTHGKGRTACACRFFIISTQSRHMIHCTYSSWEGIKGVILERRVHQIQWIVGKSTRWVRGNVEKGKEEDEGVINFEEKVAENDQDPLAFGRRASTAYVDGDVEACAGFCILEVTNQRGTRSIIALSPIMPQVMVISY